MWFSNQKKWKKMPPCHLLRPIFEASDSAGSIPDSAGLGRMQDPVTEKWFIHSPDVWWIVLMHYPYPKPPMIHLWCNIHPSLTKAPIVRQCPLECGCHSVQAKGKSQFQICFFPWCPFDHWWPFEKKEYQFATSCLLFINRRGGQGHWDIGRLSI